MKQFFEKKSTRNGIVYKRPISTSHIVTSNVENEYGAVVDNNVSEKPETTSGKKKKTNNKSNKKNNDMTIDEQISTAENIVDTMETPVKVVKKDRGLIERCESSKIILTEDNRQVLND